MFMNILYALSHINKSLQWLWFAEAMKNRGVKQTYVIIDDGVGKSSCLHDDLLKMGIESYFLPYRNKLDHIYNVLKTISIIRKSMPDVVHTSLPYGNAVGQLAACIMGIKTRITTCENASWANDFKSKRHALIDKFTYMMTHKVVATSDSAMEYLQNTFDLTDGKLYPIYHGLKESDYENVDEQTVDELRFKLGIQQNDFVIGVIARYEFWKGHEYIHKAAAILKQRNKDKNVKILVFGTKSSYYETAMKQIADMNIGDIVQYKGFVNNTVPLFRLFNVHLHVPINKYVENGGINIIEGMISERPQILTKSGYAWQSAEHMRNAYVVDYENAEEIADAIEFMKENNETARRLAAQAKKDAIRDYGLKTKVDRHIALYRSFGNIADVQLDLQLQ
jgi:glycosyltransferase involved in cell wall biosynthesis